MSSTRSIISPPPFASNALTTIPPTPVAGVSYRDPVAGPASSPDGWPYAERVNSAEFNQIMYQASSLISIIDKKGVLGWTNLVDYSEACVVFGSDGLLYEWLLASGPNIPAGVKDPALGANPTFWTPLRRGTLIGVRTFSSTTVYSPTAGTRSVLVRLQGPGGGGGGAVAPGAAGMSIGAAGGAGAYAETFFTSAFAGLTITLPPGGLGGTGAVGSTGGTASFGGLLSCPGGAGGGLSGPSSSGFIVASATSAPPTGGVIENSRGAGSDFSISINASNGQLGKAGTSKFGPGGPSSGVPVLNGTASYSLGGGGGGTALLSGASPATGGQGGGAFCVVFEYS